MTLPPPRTPTWREHGTTAVFADDGFPARTLVHFSQAGAIDGSVVRFPVALEHGETWTLDVSVQPLLGDAADLAGDEFAQHRLAERKRAEESLAEWNRSTPTLHSGWADLQQTCRRVGEALSLQYFHVTPWVAWSDAGQRGALVTRQGDN